jgi:hypothetical protein
MGKPSLSDLLNAEDLIRNPGNISRIRLSLYKGSIIASIK